MILARWSIDARFGYEVEVLKSMMQWKKEIGSSIGWTDMQLLSGSIGTQVSRIHLEVRLHDFAALEAAWNKLCTIEAHQKWGKELEPFVVSGTNRWEALRIIPDNK